MEEIVDEHSFDQASPVGGESVVGGLTADFPQPVGWGKCNDINMILLLSYTGLVR
jgi:hypothetical protein